jgi:hypothetical protein
MTIYQYVEGQELGPPPRLVRALQPGVVVGDVVYQRADGSVDKAASSSFATAPAIGIVETINNPTPGFGTVRFSGDMGGFTGLVAGDIYIMSASPGLFVREVDTGNVIYPDTSPGSGHIIQEVGIAKSSTELYVGTNRDYIQV